MSNSETGNSRGKKIVLFGLLLASCVAATASPIGASVVPSLDPVAYMGTWYEIARLDFRFERGLIRTSAEYSAGKNGTIKVVNRGYDPTRKKFKKAEGVARFRSTARDGALEVSFFGPWYAEYNVIALDESYRYALVTGKSAKYLWILSRERTIPEEIRNEYLSVAKSIGVDVDALVWVDQGQ